MSLTKDRKIDICDGGEEVPKCPYEAKIATMATDISYIKEWVEETKERLVRGDDDFQAIKIKQSYQNGKEAAQKEMSEQRRTNADISTRKLGVIIAGSALLITIIEKGIAWLIGRL